MVVREVLVTGGILLFGYGVYAVSCKIRQRWCLSRVEGQKIEEVREPLIAEDTLKDIPSFAKRLPDNIQGTTKRAKPCPVKLERSESGKSLEDEEWGRPVATGPGDGGMGNNSPVLSADVLAQSSNLHLEVISGPSAGVRISQQSKERQGVSLTVGRIAQNDLVLNDPEVSGKHALISWNGRVSKWELVDMGSLNGTLVNYRSVGAAHPLNAPVRRRGNPVGLVNGDIVTLGSTSQVLVRVLNNQKSSEFAIPSTPFGVGVAADSMTFRKGGKRLPMEDVALCQWPLNGFQEFGVFCIFDGHGGGGAAEAAARLMPEKLAKILSLEETRVKVLSQCDATEVLQDAFRETEAALEYEYEGCTATVLLVWWSEGKEMYAQCANVGDSACVFSIGDRQIAMTEDHRLTSFSERCRLLEMGKQLKDDETRLCGMNIARALGDKFLKEQDGCFSSQPYVSEAIEIGPDSRALAVIASDGLWDVMSSRRALSFALEARDGKSVTSEGRRCPAQDAESIAEMLVSKACAFRTKDNTTVIVLDFGFNTKNMFRTV